MIYHDGSIRLTEWFKKWGYLMSDIKMIFLSIQEFEHLIESKYCSRIVLLKLGIVSFYKNISLKKLKNFNLWGSDMNISKLLLYPRHWPDMIFLKSSIFWKVNIRLE